MSAADTAKEIAALFAGDLLAGGTVSQPTLDKVLNIGIAAALAALPAPMHGTAKIAARAAIHALIDASKPERAEVTAGAGAKVTGIIHD